MKIAFLLFIAREAVLAEIQLFKTSCSECAPEYDCQDVAVEMYRNLAHQRAQRHVPQLLDMFFTSEHRFFCLKGHSEVNFRFELPIPDLNMATIPTLLAFDGRQELALSVLAIRDRYVEGYDSLSQRLPSQVEKFISQLEFSDESNLLQFMSEYLMLAELAYIERNLEVISILPSLLVAATESASAESMTELLENSSGKNKRLYEMLMYVGLQSSMEPAGDAEHTTDFSRFAAIMNFIRDSNTNLEQKISTLEDPNAHPEYYQQTVENDYKVQQPHQGFSPALLFVMSKEVEAFSVEEFIFILQSTPSLAQDPIIPYLYMKDSDNHEKLRTYLMARLLNPELFQNNGNNMSTALALLQ